MNKLKLALLLVTAAGVLAVADDAAISSRAVQANNKFGLNFLAQVKRARPASRNTFLSPISAYQALSMTANGAAGDTEKAILSVIESSGMSRAELNAANSGLMEHLNARRDELALNVANSVWTDKGFPLRDTFVANVGRSYGARAESLDFRSPSAAVTINNWVSEKTNGRIKEIVESPLGSEFYLVNATYFKAEWTSSFDKGRTQPADFHLDGGKTKSVAMMRSDRFVQYAHEKGYQAVRLPYGKSASASMTVVLPTGSLSELEAGLTSDFWSDLSGKLTSSETQRIELALPKFKLAYEADLVQPLFNMGMAIAFGPLANFADLTPAPIRLNKALQKTWVDVNEKGTEAGAATIIGGVTSVPLPPEIHMIVDRPFLVSIQDDTSGAILFLGTIGEPEYKE